MSTRTLVPTPERLAMRRGFTLVELMIVVLIVAIVATLALPHYEQVLLKARAAEVVGQMDAIKVAAYNYFLESEGWPEDVDRGTVPPELVDRLPADFTFDRGDYLLDWDHWALPDGTPTEPGTGVLVGISLVTDDEDLGNAFLQLLGGGVSKFTISDHYTMILETI